MPSIEFVSDAVWLIVAWFAGSVLVMRWIDR
jgi:hypothetical protein